MHLQLFLGGRPEKGIEVEREWFVRRDGVELVEEHDDPVAARVHPFECVADRFEILADHAHGSRIGDLAPLLEIHVKECVLAGRFEEQLANLLIVDVAVQRRLADAPRPDNGNRLWPRRPDAGEDIA